jgi:hypothetical protein
MEVTSRAGSYFDEFDSCAKATAQKVRMIAVTTLRLTDIMLSFWSELFAGVFKSDFWNDHEGAFTLTPVYREVTLVEGKNRPDPLTACEVNQCSIRQLRARSSYRFISSAIARPSFPVSGSNVMNPPSTLLNNWRTASGDLRSSQAASVMTGQQDNRGVGILCSSLTHSS